MSDTIVKLSRNTGNAPLSNQSTQSVAFSHYNNISAQLPIDPKNGELVSGDIKRQANQCLSNIKAIIESIDKGMYDVVRVNVYLKNITDIEAMNEVYRSLFPSHLPTRTVLAVAALPVEGALVQMDAVVSNGEGTYPQEPCDLIKQVRNTPSAPICAHSTHSVAFSHYNHLSAQLPIDPITGSVVAGGVKEQAHQCLLNIKNILASIDVPFDDVVKVNVHIINGQFAEKVDEVYRTFFPDSAIARTVAYMPARSFVVAEALPMNALVQMDVTVSHGDGTPPQAVEDRHGIVIKARNTENAPVSAMSSQTVAFSHYNNITAQLPFDAKVGATLAVGVKEQTVQCLDNIKQIVESTDHVMDDIVKVNIQLTDMRDLDSVNEIYARYFNKPLPARTVIAVSKLPLDASVQIDAIVSNAEGTPPNK